MDVARQGEVTGLSVPCLFIAAKDDLDSYPMAIKDSTKVASFVVGSVLFCIILSIKMFLKKKSFLIKMCILFC